MTKTSLFALLILLVAAPSSAAETPNIVYILADDLGYGDLSHAGGKAPTPHCDRLAREGLRFTDAHTTSSVCTPTRYGILTGRYNWRSRLKKSVFFNPHEQPLIPASRPTVASLLKQQGYHTACIGKWHLGIGWKFLEQPPKLTSDQKGQGWDIDYAQSAVTPTSVGFDYFYGIQASLDMAPYVYIENDRAVTPATVTKAFHRPGAASADFEAVDCLTQWAEHSVAYINQRAQAKERQPFFLYLPLTSPHTPIVPSKAWQGKSGFGSYGDFLMETDWVVGEVLQALDRNNLTKDTLVIFTADNGCSPAAKIPQLIKSGHKPNGDWRGHKADIYEGGHRVPFIVRWPGHVTAASSSDRTLCTTDMFATAAAIVGQPNTAEDSISFLPTLLGQDQDDRGITIHHSINGSFAIRQGNWKLCLCPGSGGWSAPRPNVALKDRKLPPVQLFNLETDPAERANVQEKHPDVVEELVGLLANAINNGRTTPGPRLENDGGPNPFPARVLAAYPDLVN
ncbi:MAG: arylsulfatase [Pirellulaceae bacterium]|nr:arylsulfatase [Pirellulaceae bacterium]